MNSRRLFTEARSKLAEGLYCFIGKGGRAFKCTYKRLGLPTLSNGISSKVGEKIGKDMSIVQLVKIYLCPRLLVRFKSRLLPITKHSMTLA